MAQFRGVKDWLLRRIDRRPEISVAQVLAHYRQGVTHRPRSSETNVRTGTTLSTPEQLSPHGPETRHLRAWPFALRFAYRVSRGNVARQSPWVGGPVTRFSLARVALRRPALRKEAGRR